MVATVLPSVSGDVLADVVEVDSWSLVAAVLEDVDSWCLSGGVPLDVDSWSLPDEIFWAVEKRFLVCSDGRSLPCLLLLEPIKNYMLTSTKSE